MKINLAKLKAKRLVWSKWNREHIGKHNLIPRQVEQVLLDENKIKKAHSGKIAVVGKCGKRLAAIFLTPSGKEFYVATARDASKKERQAYRKNL